MLTLNDGRTELWQWDTGRTLAVDADCSQVHFSNKVFGRSIDVDVTGGVAIIPDILLQTDKDLNVWAFVGTAENGYTKISKTFKVNRRNKPADYVFTQTDQMTLQTIQRQIGDLSDLTTEAKDTLVAAINEAAQTGGGGGGIVIDSTLTKRGQAADAAEVGARLSSLSEEIVTTSESKVAAHNIGTDTHSDIRLLIQGLTDRLNAMADSDDTTLDQLSEIVAYIKSNRDLIAAITTDKVSVADIIDNLTTNVTNKPLSAAQGVALKALIDAISIPDKLPNPNALTFTGAVTGSYDGSAPLSVEIPSGGGGGGSSQWKIIRDITITENADRVDINTDDAGEAFSLHEIQVFSYTKSYRDTEESFTFLMNGYWGKTDPYFQSGFKSTASSDNYYVENHFIATMQNGIADVFQPWKQYIINSSSGGDKYSIGDKYQAIESVSFVGKFIAGCRFVLVGRVSS